MAQTIQKKTIALRKFQAPFFECKARYPGFIGGWGTGKTMLLILKALWMSRAYKNNLGVIVRKEFVDLRDSTMKDFEEYTGLKILKGRKEIIVPGTNSLIMFRHGQELNEMQNINLGWFALEQAEEFDNADGFDQLRGRLRRDLIPDKSWTPHPDYKEYGDWLKEEGRRVGMVIANSNGHNWIWRRWVRGIAGGTDYKGFLANTFDNHSILKPDFLEDLRKLEHDNPKKYKRYVLNSQDEFDIEGSIYGERLDEIQALGRCGDFTHDTSKPVHVVMDPGYHTALWFFQTHNMAPVFLRCFECIGGGVEGIIEICDEFKKKYNYRMGQFFAPFDVDNNAHRTTHGDTLLEAFKENGIRVKVLPLEKRVTDGIVRTHRFLGQCFFDVGGCEIGIEALHRYRYAKNKTMSTEERSVFGTIPVKDWEVHLVDSFRYASLAVPKAAMFDREHNTQTERTTVCLAPGMF